MPIEFAKLDLRDALDLAILIEEEARERYQEFTRIVGGRYPGDAADVFRMMAANEEKHHAELVARRKKLFPRQKVRVSSDMLDDVEAPDRGKPRVFMSARQAMEVAMESEEKARDFFAEARKHVKDAKVKKLFAELEAEEQKHHKTLADRIRKLPKGPDVEEAEADEPGSDAG
ncbi:MAG TPA: ferritin family protein [Anaeromyxobacteraceae bacterium]|nr:ferritin family protein [Anaeromyxobacteraceae bacterium]